jgi:hypothetical protein
MLCLEFPSELLGHPANVLLLATQIRCRVAALSLARLVSRGNLNDLDSYKVPTLNFALQPAQMLCRTVFDTSDVQPEVSGNSLAAFLVRLRPAPR